MKKVGIIGSGTMGIGIAQVAATAEVFLYDANFSQTEKSLKNLKTTLNKLAEKGKISTEKSLEIFNQIKPCQEIKELKDCDLVIEAIIENKEIKQKVFAELETYVSENCVLGSNTSSISITSLQSELKNPERFIEFIFSIQRH
jgi:3-hydroxybutyryl-CoA dehydrogenase